MSSVNNAKSSTRCAGSPPRFHNQALEDKRSNNMKRSSQTRSCLLLDSLSVGLRVAETETNIGVCLENKFQNVILGSSRTKGNNSRKLHLMQRPTSPLIKDANLLVLMMQMESIIFDLDSIIKSALESVQNSGSDINQYI